MCDRAAHQAAVEVFCKKYRVDLCMPVSAKTGQSVARLFMVNQWLSAVSPTLCASLKAFRCILPFMRVVCSALMLLFVSCRCVCST